MAEDKDQLVDEATMEKMSVAPPDPETEARGSQDGGGNQRLESDHESADPPSGVADQDPLSAHPS
jgi:hypothetical protein